MAQLCDQREFVLKTSPLWNCQSAERRFFIPVIPLPVIGAGSRSALVRLQSLHSVQRSHALNSGVWGCWCLLNFFSLLDLQKWKVSLKRSPQEATEGRYWQEMPFFPFLTKDYWTALVHISSSKGSSEKVTDEGKKHVNLTWGMLKKPTRWIEENHLKTIKYRMSGPTAHTTGVLQVPVWWFEKINDL